MKIHITITDEKGNSYSGTADLVKSSGKAKKLVISSGKPKKKRPIDVIKELYEEGFFKEEKKLDEIKKELKSKGFNFRRSSIYNGIQRSDFLKQEGPKGKSKFIQKYPPS